MLFLRAVLLEILVCFHVIGGAALFRRLFPNESPWLGFFLPTLAVMTVFNFTEHFVALPVLGWILPFSVGGLLWALLRPGYRWEGLKVPTVLFLVAFTFVLAIRCLEPQVSSNTEGTADLTRVLDFSLGDKLPPTDCWMPPLDHGGYYQFQHYGASLLKRVLSLDLGTAYNMGFVLLDALTCLAGAGVAYRISGDRTWVAACTLLVVMSSYTGSAPLLFFHHFSRPEWPDFPLSIDIHEDWDKPERNPFAWYLGRLADHPTLRLFPPGYNIYCAEFHANLGGQFMTLLSVLAGVEAFRLQRSSWAWVCLLVLPFYTVITAAWYFFVVAAVAFGSLVVGLAAGRRPHSWIFVLLGTGLAAILIWPTFNDLITDSVPQAIFWTPKEGHTPFWTFVFQWWPVYLPWFALLFIWNRMPFFGRWMHILIALMFVGVEFLTFGDRGLTVEKMWGAIYGAGLVTLLPLVYVEAGLIFRGLTVILLFCATVCLAGWTRLNLQWADWHGVVMQLKGDSFLENDPQKKRLLQVLRLLHAETILPGKSGWSYTPAPAIITFSENRSYVAWYYQEIQCGHGGEAEYRNQTNNSFYAGTLPLPLAFLEDNHISGVMIWPDDNISDALLEQMKQQIGVDYFYVDCKTGGPNNCGLFIRRAVSRAPATAFNPAPLPPPAPVAPAAAAAAISAHHGAP